MDPVSPRDVTGLPVLVVSVTEHAFGAAHAVPSSATAPGDPSGPRLVALLTQARYAVSGPVVVPDRLEEVAAALRDGVAAGHRMIVTTGGTGVARHDLTPEATRTVLTREVPGVAETLRSEGARHTPLSALSRGLVGIADAAGERDVGTLVVNLPGSVQAVEQGVDVLLPLLPHLLDMIVGWDDAGG
jgi:molybdenum cofactor synthesis domain-containing protein